MAHNISCVFTVNRVALSFLFGLTIFLCQPPHAVEPVQDINSQSTISQMTFLKPKFKLIPTGQQRNRTSIKNQQISNKICYQFATQTKVSSFTNFERSFRGKIPQIWDE